MIFDKGHVKFRKMKKKKKQNKTKMKKKKCFQRPVYRRANVCEM